MKKRAYIELMQERLSGGDTPDDIKGKYHPLVLEKYIGAAYGSLMNSVYKQSQISKDYAWLDSVAYSIPLALQANGEDRSYVNLPKGLLQLPQSGQIRFIGLTGSKNVAFRLKTNDEAEEIFKHLDVGKIDDTNYCYIERERLYFEDISANKIETITVKAVKNFESMEDEDEFSAPKGMDYEMMRILFDIMREQQATPEELYNDRKPDFNNG